MRILVPFTIASPAFGFYQWVDPLAQDYHARVLVRRIVTGTGLSAELRAMKVSEGPEITFYLAVGQPNLPDDAIDAQLANEVDVIKQLTTLTTVA